MKNRQSIDIVNMTCPSCEERIKRALSKLEGVAQVQADYTKGQVEIVYNPDVLSLEQIKATLSVNGYEPARGKKSRIIGVVFVFLAIILLYNYNSGFNLDDQLTKNTTYLLLFTIGILTSLHCVGMCGGIMLSQTLNASGDGRLAALKPSLQYNLGRLLSYTMLGGFVGALGGIISFTPTFKAGLLLFTSAFMVIMGLNMLGVGPFRRLRLTLSFCKFKKGGNPRTPFLVGLLNGLMPCGPLQTMQLFALGTGSATKGALAMFVFALGTIPLMLTFGSLTSFLSKGFTRNIAKYSGVLVLILGLIMANRGLTMAGINLSPIGWAATSGTAPGMVTKAEIVDGVQVIKMSANDNGYVPNVFYVQKGIPVRWEISGDSLNSCNNAILVGSLNIEKKLRSGLNIVEFTPDASKDMGFSCWMGMIRGSIRVVDDLAGVDLTQAKPVPTSGGMSCCKGGGAQQDSGIADIPTERLLGKAVIGEVQTAAFTIDEIGLKPFAMVVEKERQITLNIDITKIPAAKGRYTIVDFLDGKVVKVFLLEETKTQVSLEPLSRGLYAIVKDNRTVLGVLSVVDDLAQADLEQLRDEIFE